MITHQSVMIAYIFRILFFYVTADQIYTSKFKFLEINRTSYPITSRIEVPEDWNKTGK